jgi:polysaccharide export outer membrane protein
MAKTQSSHLTLGRLLGMALLILALPFPRAFAADDAAADASASASAPPAIPDTATAPAPANTSSMDPQDPTRLSATGVARTQAIIASATNTLINGYKLYPGDLLHVQVFDNPDLETELRIPDTGTITFPLIGQIDHLVGKSLEELSHEISARLMDGYLRQAVITISIKEFGRREATVMGSVKNPGPVELDPFRAVTSLEAIGEVGGFTDDANRASGVIIRNNPQTGESQTFSLPKQDTADALRYDTVLLPGDRIIVPRLESVFILGQVTRPGAVDLPALQSLTVSKGISIAGGFDKYAKTSKVYLIRNNEKVRLIDVGAILEGDTKEEDPILKPGDTVYVPESRL